MGAPVLDNFCSELAGALSTCLTRRIKRQEIESLSPSPKKRRQNPDSQQHTGHSNKVTPVPEEDSLDIEDFVNQYKCSKQPVLIKNVISHWPAISKDSSNIWSISYFQKIAGYRTVPVEIGSRYTDDDWTQRLMTINEFIEKYVSDSETNKKGYLAQHNLFDQVTELKNDFYVPEYCYTGEEDSEDISTNIWLGPSGTISPLHTDPKHNCLCQVFGKKYVRLYAEDQSEYLAAFDSGILTNTSQLDIEESEEEIMKSFPNFSKAHGFECILDAGDILYIPPKCWHFVKSLSVSCSLSFWFQ